MSDLPLSPSGLPTVDARWGGLAAGSTTLLVGRAGAGRTALALQSAGATVAAGGRALLLSPRTPEALLEAGTAGGFDLRAAHATGRFRVLRIPAAADLATRGADGLDAAYRSLAGIVQKDPPDRVVVEDLTPLVQFDTFERFRTAFSGFATSVCGTGASLVVGLGEPANDASQQLLAVAREAADGVVTLTTENETPQISLARRDDAEPQAEPAQAEPAQEVPAQTAAPEASPFPTESPFAEAPQAEAPQPQSSDGASVEVQPPAAPPAAEPQMAAPLPAAPAAAMPPAMPPPAAPPLAMTPPAAPAPALPPAAPAAPVTAAPAPPVATSTEAPSSDHLPRTRIVPPPDASPELLRPAGDTFGQDPATSMFEQGYLVDSGASGVVGFVPASAAPAAPMPPSPPAPPAPAPLPPAPPAPAPAPVAAPAFAPLGGGAPAPAPTPEADVRQTLDAAFAARAQGTPFLVVAARMDPASPEAAHFFAVADGLRRALRAEDRLLVDLPRRRSVIVLPNIGSEGATALFARLQGHLRAELGASAESVLAAVAAVSIPDGQPFASTTDLLAYAYES